MKNQYWRTLKLPTRTRKPREYGLSFIMDLGIPLRDLSSILEDFHGYLDLAKFGIGSAYLCPNLREKIDLYRQYDIQVCFGGTLFEKFYAQGKLGDYLDFLREMEVEWIEISNGTTSISHAEMLNITNRLSSDFKIIAEVGAKDPAILMPPSQWINEIKSFLDNGCRYVIMEGRASSSAGLYRENGEIRTGLIADIINVVDSRKLIFEAATTKGQLYFINLLGANVNLGNIRPHDIFLLETQRSGLKSDTFYLEDPEGNIHHSSNRRSS